ncbi:hypothetical protein D3C79_834480 [compost metagenome]
MVVLLLLVDAKAQHDNIQERLGRQLYTASAVVVASAELQLVDAGTVVVTLQQRRVDAAIAVGQGGVHQLQLLAFDTVQLDLDRAARAAMRGIQYVCGQTSHCLSPLVQSVGKKYTAIITPKGLRCAGMTPLRHSIAKLYTIF